MQIGRYFLMMDNQNQISVFVAGTPIKHVVPVLNLINEYIDKDIQRLKYIMYCIHNNDSSWIDEYPSMFNNIEPPTNNISLEERIVEAYNKTYYTTIHIMEIE